MFNVGRTNEDEGFLLNTTIQEATYKWNGKIGLATPSDYVKASTYVSCISVDAYNNNKYCYENSVTHNWMFMAVGDSRLWTITPGASEYAVFGAESFDIYNDAIVSNTLSVAPVFFLNSNIIISGTGTSSDPYIPTLSQ